MIVEGQTELLDAIEEARARLALATGAREAPDLATELDRLEGILASSDFEERTRPLPRERGPSGREARRFLRSRQPSPIRGRPSSCPGKSESSK